MIDDTQLPDLQDTQAMLDNPEDAQELPAQEQQTPAPAPQPLQQPVQETAPQRSFKELRAEKERIERERDEAIRKLKEAEMRSVEAEISIGDDDIVEGKHLSKTLKRMKQLEEEVRTTKEQAAMYAVQATIKTRYPDFEKVVTTENLERLRNTYPEVAYSVDTNPDLLNKAVAAYELIQKFGITESDPYMQDKQKAQANASKPKPTATLSPQQGGSPLERANAFEHGLTDDLKKQLLNEMKEAMKNR